MADQTLKCSDCAQDWVYTQDEQDHIERNGYSAPKRCKDCRWKKKQRFEAKG